jgi:hypothetical protein
MRNTNLNKAQRFLDFREDIHSGDLPKGQVNKIPIKRLSYNSLSLPRSNNSGIFERERNINLSDSLLEGVS